MPLGETRRLSFSMPRTIPRKYAIACGVSNNAKRSVKEAILFQLSRIGELSEIIIFPLESTLQAVTLARSSISLALSSINLLRATS